MPSPLLGEGTNYCTSLDAAQIRGNTAKESDVQQWWLDAVDALIDNHMAGGYKGAERTTVQGGRGNRLLRLPSKAVGLVSITEDTRVMATSEYRLDPGGRLVKRKAINPTMWPLPPGCWLRDIDYTIVYTEPPLDDLPDLWRIAAADCVSKVMMFAEKNKSFGIALTASDQASAGKVSTGASTSFPANLVEEIRRTLKATLTKPMM